MCTCNRPNCISCSCSWEAQCDPAGTSCFPDQQCRPGPEICISRPCTPECRPKPPIPCRQKCRPQPPRPICTIRPPSSVCCSWNRPMPDCCIPPEPPCSTPDFPHRECEPSWQEFCMTQLMEAFRRMFDSCRS